MAAKRAKTKAKKAPTRKRVGASKKKAATKKSAARKASKKATATKASKKKSTATRRRAGSAGSAPKATKAERRKATPGKRPKVAADPDRSGSVVPGSRAPDFRLQDQEGRWLSSKELRGAPYVLYFYPKDDTPGCTQEACDFRDAISAFKRAGARVIGVSPDSVATHAKFTAKQRLPFTLLSDNSRVVCNTFGVWVKKRLYGREYMGVERSTFVVGPTGVVRRVWRGVRVPGHAAAVLAAVRERG